MKETIRIKNKKSGITLIALVITIIVLLILAGITINLTLGQNGIMNMAEKAGRNYLNAQEEEKTEIAKLNNEIDGYIDGNRENEHVKKARQIYYIETLTSSVGNQWCGGGLNFSTSGYSLATLDLNNKIIGGSTPTFQRMDIYIKDNTTNEVIKNNEEYTDFSTIIQIPLDYTHEYEYNIMIYIAEPSGVGWSIVKYPFILE